MPIQDIQTAETAQTSDDASRHGIGVGGSTHQLNYTNSSGTNYVVVEKDLTQTLTNKTLTTPKIAQINDTAGVNRVVANVTAKTIVDGSATSLADIACPNGSTSGGMLFYHIQASDGTDFQAMSGMVAYAMVNKAGTNTLTITDVTANNAKAVSSGTLTLAWTFVTGTAKGTIKLQPTGSLTESTPYNVTYTVFPMIGAVSIL